MMGLIICSAGSDKYLFFDRILLAGDKEGLLMLPTDKVLLKDPEMLKLIELYAKVPANPLAPLCCWSSTYS